MYWNLSLMVQQLAANEALESCTSKLCLEFGFLDRWEVMETAASAKLWMSLCVCIQLLKIIKFTNVIVPKMSLMTRVLAKGCYDLLFFGIIFMIAMFAFCMLFHVQVRPAAPTSHPTTPTISPLLFCSSTCSSGRTWTTSTASPPR